jgi:carbamoyltransferase
MDRMDPKCAAAEETAGASEIARLLVDESAIVAVVRGRQEFGPRALGHRSLLASPAAPGIQARMNRLKVREPWRPTAPMIAAEAVAGAFDLDFEAMPQPFGVDARTRTKQTTTVLPSPYMSFARRMTDEACAALPAACHADGTARLQTVTRAFDPWEV